ncbi:hypothetical protein [Streptomyces cucumeris]|uniref:hypothetical protein n=1 Tax=Streptomyces cucumeris TaxID=2962890 RepID=UPI0020C89ECF|nr:hypothetical protein [Streptomyces sp. NEAU-Y11]MCP9207185.1 hypothetical protein [Streptomyces sp. NEAU-Y11]
MENRSADSSDTSSTAHGIGGYASAQDLPSVRQLHQQLRQTRALRFLIPRDQRPDLAVVERRLQHLCETVDAFYQVLGPRNWIFHENLPVDAIAELLTSEGGPEAAEEAFIALYTDQDALASRLQVINKLPALRKRRHLILKAHEDYAAGRYYACIHLLISVMDGFVNEFETVRRGLHARQAEDLHAWDSVVGHHMGLANAHKTFIKGKSATNEDPVYELYRNGIVHGSLLNYDNVVVATKAWNRLFAVVDWANATLKEKTPPPSRPTMRQLWHSLSELSRHQKANDAWKPHRVSSDDASFSQEAPALATEQFLTAWTQCNYGRMAQWISQPIRDKHGAAMPREVRMLYKDRPLSAFAVLTVDHIAPASCLVEVEVHLADQPDGQAVPATFRWLYEDPQGDPVSSLLPGQWRLYCWEPDRFIPYPDLKGWLKPDPNAPDAKPDLRERPQGGLA